MAKLTKGRMAPDFTLPDQEGKERSLKDFQGSGFFLYFYPKDDTTGCTKEACAIRDEFPKFKKMKAVVLGMSADTTASHKKFAEKYHLPFILLSDTLKKVLKKYNVYGKKKFMGREYRGILRTSFLIDPKEIIVCHTTSKQAGLNFLSQMEPR